MNTPHPIDFYLLTRELVKANLEDAIENLKDVPDQNSCMAGSYMGEIDAYRYILDWLDEQFGSNK